MQHDANCQALHRFVRTLKRHRFPFDPTTIPQDGIYFLFERGERAHGGERVVRVGTHTGVGQLGSRLYKHFVNENKDRSIFRKNIGRALLNKARDPYLAVWELDFTPAKARKTNGHLLKTAKQQKIERAVTHYLQKQCSFAVLQVANKQKRLALESKIISTLSHCPVCKPSKGWLGNYSPKEKICKSGLWLVNELYKTPLSSRDLLYLQSL